MKRYVVFAGVNGAGKTTLYQANDEYLDMPRINLDEIVRDIGSWKNKSNVAKAGLIAVKQIKELFLKEDSFNQETTLCGHMILRNIRQAKELGYEVVLYYVGLDSADLAKERVRQRVSAGGHGIPEADIERRYSESIHNLKNVLEICDHVYIYDNSRSFVKIAEFMDGKLVDVSEYVPAWISELIEKSGGSVTKIDSRV